MSVSIESESSRVPAAAGFLGALGAIPFIGCAIAATYLEGVQRAEVIFALNAYGAAILSFLGGIQWGLAIAVGGGNLRRLGVSVVPSLIGWAALLLPTGPGAIVMAAGFVCVLLIDIRASRIQQAPSWYPKLRWPLTVVAVSAILTGGVLG